MKMDSIQEISSDEFEEIRNAEVPIVLDFYSTECAPVSLWIPKYVEDFDARIKRVH